MRDYLRGQRTYILAALAVLAELAKWAVGDQTLGALIDHLPMIFSDLGLATLRAGIAWHAEAQAPHREELAALLQELLATARPQEPQNNGS